MEPVPATTATPQPSGVPAAKRSVASFPIDIFPERLTRLDQPRITSMPSMSIPARPRAAAATLARGSCADAKAAATAELSSLSAAVSPTA
jgi:hypothetical protein